MTEDQLDVLSDYLSPGIKAPLQAHLAKQGRKRVVSPLTPAKVVAAAAVDRTSVVKGFGLPYGAAPVSLVVEAPSPVPADGEPLTMSSLEIAELTGKEHKNVIRDIRKMLVDLDLHAPDFSGTYKTDRGNTYDCFDLPRREVDILLTGYSTTMRAAVIDRWRVLEAEAAQPVHRVPTSFLEAMKLATELEEKRLQLTHQVDVQAAKIAQDEPKVKVFTKLIEQKDVISFQKFCTQLNLHQRKIKGWLRDIGWLRADQWEVNPLPTAKAVDAGYCDIKRFETESGRLKQQIVFTSKAEAYVELKAPEYVRKPVRKERKKAG